MLRNLTLASVIASTLCFGAAQAADLGTVTNPPFPEYEWTGIYVGGFAGASFEDFGVKALAAQSHTSTLPTSGVFGGLVGANYQLSESVLGVEGEFGAGAGDATSSGIGTFAFAQTAEQNWVGRVRARIGFVLGQALVFAAGGVSFGDGKITLVDQRATPGAGGSITQTFTGWNFGGGLDYYITPNWIGRVEYIYDNFGSANYGFSAATGGNFSDRSVRIHSSTFRVGAIYKFATN